MGITISTACNLLDICSLKPCEVFCVYLPATILLNVDVVSGEKKRAVPGKLKKLLVPTDK